MREYDQLFLLNCGALVPWSAASKVQGNADGQWTYIRQSVCRQKTSFPPPNHEWRSIFSQEDLETKTRATIVSGPGSKSLTVGGWRLSMLIVFVHGWSVTNIDTYGGLPAAAQKKCGA
jgi:hypothetical protein